MPPTTTSRLTRPAAPVPRAAPLVALQLAVLVPAAVGR
jgi:hypothetical protein